MTTDVEADSLDRLEQVALVVALCRSGQARRIREERGLSLADMAEAVGSPAASIARWETGTRPHRDGAIRYGRVLAALADLIPT